MRGLDLAAVDAADLEQASAQDVLKYGVENFHPRLTMACSFQKEESVLVHMLLEAEPAARYSLIRRSRSAITVALSSPSSAGRESTSCAP